MDPILYQMQAIVDGAPAIPLAALVVAGLAFAAFRVLSWILGE